MAIFAILENNIVVNTVAADDIILVGLVLPDAELALEVTDATGIAVIGGEYVPAKKKFKPLQPYPSWGWNSKEWSWASPVPYPSKGGPYIWNEELQTWENLSEHLPSV